VAVRRAVCVFVVEGLGVVVLVWVGVRVELIVLVAV